ncbi:hypothetical protein DRO66_06160 [Candidatus Bathyarchaeota archaeon]|nr:MAG: hypothetical protein DRO66_06160 [Candidatus Bathyarchaeota archaeon]
MGMVIWGGYAKAIMPNAEIRNPNIEIPGPDLISKDFISNPSLLLNGSNSIHHQSRRARAGLNKFEA